MPWAPRPRPGAPGWGNSIFDAAVELRRQSLQHVAQIGQGLVAAYASRLHQGLITTAVRWPASSLHKNIQALRPIAQGLICRSRWLLSMGTSPSSRCCVSFARRLSV